MTAVVLARLPLVDLIARRVARRVPFHVRLEDLVGAGALALVELIRRVGGRGAFFEGHLRVRLEGAMLDELRHQDWVGRRTRQTLETQGSGAPRFVPIDEATAVTSRGDPAEVGADLGRLLSRLPARDRWIVISVDLHGTPVGRLARELGISSPRVSQLRSRALAQLRTLVKGAPL